MAGKTRKLKRPDWDSYFMQIAQVVALRSNCSRRQVAAVIVIVGLGTRADMRLEGIASALVARLVEECLADGKRFVCGFYRSRETGRLCERLGFEPIGSYAMLY